jgi:hypothetical protein
MPDYSLEELRDILIAAEPGGAFDQADRLLRERKRGDLADALIKLQQDAGLEADPTFDPNDRANPSGPITARLWNYYEPLTKSRIMRIMNESAAVLNDPPSDVPSLFPSEI